MAGVEEVAGVPFAGGEGVAGGEGHVEFGAEGVEGILPVFGGLGAVNVEDGDEDTVGAEHAGVAGAFPEGEVSSSMDADKGGEEVVLVFGRTQRTWAFSRVSIHQAAPVVAVRRRETIMASLAALRLWATCGLRLSVSGTHQLKSS